MPTIKANNINIYYETYGSGQPLVFVAGFSGDHTAWQGLIDTFAKHYQVIVFDNRGIGQTDCPNMPYTTEMLADDVAELLKALKVESAHVVGHSFGGCIVQTLAYKHPQLCKSIVIASSFIKANMRLRLYGETRLEFIEAQAPETAVIKFISMFCFSNQFLSQPRKVDELIEAGFFPISTQGYQNQLNALLTFNSTAWINQIKCPALIIGADEDLVADIEDSQKMASAIQNAEYYGFENVGHVPQMEAPEKFIELISAFLKNH